MINKVQPSSYAKYYINGFLFYPEGTPIKSIYYPEIYILEDNQLRHVKNLHTFNRLGYTNTDVRDVSQAIIDSFVKGKEISL